MSIPEDNDSQAPTATGGAPGAPDTWWDQPDPSDAPPEANPPPAGWKKWAIGGVGAAVIAGGAVFGINAAVSHSSDQSAATSAGQPAAGAAGQPGQMPGVMGAITGIDGSTITVEGTNATQKVTTSDSTKVITSSTGSLSDIKVGDHVRIMVSGSDGQGTAQRIVDSGSVESTDIGGPGGGGGGGAPPAMPRSGSSGASAGQAPPSGGGAPANMAMTAGTVASLDGDSLTVTLSDGSTSTLTVGDSTQVELSTVGSIDSLEKGDTVMVTGQTSGDTVAADTIRVGGLPSGPAGGGGAPGSAAPSTTTAG